MNCYMGNLLVIILPFQFDTYIMHFLPSIKPPNKALPDETCAFYKQKSNPYMALISKNDFTVSGKICCPTHAPSNAL